MGSKLIYLGPFGGRFRVLGKVKGLGSLEATDGGRGNSCTLLFIDPRSGNILLHVPLKISGICGIETFERGAGLVTV